MLPEFNTSLKEFKSGFFDRAEVKNDVDKTTAKVFSKLGAYIMRRARKSLRRGKRFRKATPGKPPVSHTDLLRKSILFRWDKPTRSVIVGAYLFNSGERNPTVPQLLEYGGRSSQSRKKYHSFPFIRPAAAAEMPKLPQFWREARAAA